MAPVLLLVLLLPCYVSGQSSFTDPLKINFPDLLVHAVSKGNVNLMTQNGDIHIENGTGKVIFDGEDLNYIIQLIISQPPIWDDHSAFGYLGEYHSGQKIDVTIIAKDPEGHAVQYSLVAGTLPPGVNLDSDLGRIYGLIPDSDATYTVTIRATDIHGHFADSVFKIVTRGIIYCSKSPCKNQGVCQDLEEGYKCFCANPYGGFRCEIDCRSNHLIGPSNAKKMPDAALTGYNMYSSNSAYTARMNLGGWWGEDATSYLQVDFGNVTHVDNIQMKGRNSNRYYYTGSYYIQYSLDGNTFYNFTSNINGNVYRFSGSSSSSIQKTNLPEPLYTRFIRFFPISWNTSYRPYMNVEVNGCYKI